MKYIALLRGINISGKNKISMPELKKLLEENNYQNVSTYLNIHTLIKTKFILDIPVYITTDKELEDILNNSPKWWGSNNKEIYDNLIFIIPPTKYEEVYNTIGLPKEGLEQIEEYNNCIFWSFDLNNYRKSNWWVKTASTDIKDKITIRTANTMRKILEICQK